eukprot:3285902-Rhodomonas_salina.1
MAQGMVVLGDGRFQDSGKPATSGVHTWCELHAILAYAAAPGGVGMAKLVKHGLPKKTADE